MKRYLLVFLCLLGSSALAATEFKIITLQHRFANDLLPVISPMVGAEGTATGIRNQLILRASPERIREIEATIQQLDTARVNRRITVNTNNNSQLQRSRTDLSGKVKVGRVTIGNDKYAAPNSANINIERSSSRTQHNSSQFLNVLDGERAFIRVGHSIPFTQDWVVITSRYIQTGSTTDWRDVSTGFAVRPRTIGNQVELEITPRIAKRNGLGYIDFEELSTTVRVSLGEWVDIGSTMQNRDDVSRKILGVSNSSSHQNSSLVIKVD
ncbi:MAG: nodulation protein NolW [Methylophilaceae bacterium]|nr:MAG: nodulation protein NolW [Methylophilaceae bacterium]